ncbi:replication factor C subunit 2/4 [Enteropsectra breve]|nr:replication factor C subunit 2/4 [Enteropsectra breve]
MADSSLWTEKYRPQKSKDLNCPEHIRRFLEDALANGFPHLLLYGPPGTGKTSFAQLLSPTLTLNASDERGIDVIRNKIKKRANTVSKQVIVLDECENLTRDAQTCLRRVLEDFPNTRFVFCTNYYNRIIGPLKSRLLKFKFTLQQHGALEKIGESEGLAYPSEFYSYIFKRCNGDMRRSINVMQGLAPLNPPFSISGDNFIIDDFIGMIPDKIIREFMEIRRVNLKEFCKMFLDASYSCLQLIQQLSESLWGSSKQMAQFSLVLSELEGKCINGCSDEFVLYNVCFGKIEIYS